MYSTCLFCRAKLGANDAIEHFPVGRRLAFDAAKGRLWAVCLKCGRWNLTPLEERWEAIEECERRFRDTRTRASTGEIGLARLADGTALVRIGAPLLPEMAAWRYGTRLDERRRRAAVADIAGRAGGVVAGSLITLSMGLLAPPILLAAGLQRLATRERIVTRTSNGRGATLTIRAKHLRRAELIARGGALHALEVEHDGGEARIEGAAALHAVRALLPALNAAGATEDDVAAVARRIEQAGGATPFLNHLASSRPRDEEETVTYQDHAGRQYTDWFEGRGSGLLHELARADRLALEIAANEEFERTALEGELAALHAAWREAEEIAAIADDLALPPWVHDALRRHRDGGAESR